MAGGAGVAVHSRRVAGIAAEPHLGPWPPTNRDPRRTDLHPVLGAVRPASRIAAGGDAPQVRRETAAHGMPCQSVPVIAWRVEVECCYMTRFASQLFVAPSQHLGPHEVRLARARSTVGCTWVSMCVARCAVYDCVRSILCRTMPRRATPCHTCLPLLALWPHRAAFRPAPGRLRRHGPQRVHRVRGVALTVPVLHAAAPGWQRRRST